MLCNSDDIIIPLFPLTGSIYPALIISQQAKLYTNHYGEEPIRTLSIIDEV